MDQAKWERLARLFDAAAPLSLAARSRYLDAACRGDRQLRREAEALLAGDAEPAVIDHAIGPSVLQWVEDNSRVKAGDLVGPFRIDSLLGIGGMGEVYRARDTKLNRDVAIKVLPASFALDPDRLARFKREAQVLASLNHPNIAAIYGLEEWPTCALEGASAGKQAGDEGLAGTASMPCLVLELVEGPTLADRIQQGALSVDEALAIARQIVGALEAAHEQGIVHRDLKPANIKVRDDGTVKVLDFGLAKMAEASPDGQAGRKGQAGQAALTDSPTITTPAMTEVGMILGTAAYMSPEQAKGKPADKRSDIWAFGCVLYEMFTGKRAFHADDVPETLAAVLTRTPAVSPALASSHPALKKVIGRCLERDRRRRYADVSDIRLDLEDAVAPAPESRSIAAAPLGKSRLPIAMAAVLGVAVAAMAFTVLRPARTTVAPGPVIRSEIQLPAELAGQPGSRFALSPDGQRLAFVATDATGRVQLWVRPLSAATAQPLTGAEGASGPFWSPDSRFIAFTAAGKLRRIDAAGGPVTALCDSVAGLPGAWSTADVILFTPTLASALYRVSADGRECRPATKEEAITRHAFPQFLSDQRHFLYVSETANGSARHFEVASLDGTDVQALAEVGLNPTVLANDQVLFATKGGAWVQRFDLNTRRFVDDARTVVEGVDIEATGRFGAAVSASRNGVVVFQPNTVRPVHLTWFDRQGTALGTFGPSDFTFRMPRLSPDGAFLAIDGRPIDGNEGGIWLFDLANGIQRKFTRDPAAVTYATWSPDSLRVVFASRRRGRLDLFENARDGGAGAEQLVYADDLDKFPTSWSPDGNTLLFNAVSPQTGSDIWMLPMAGSGPRRATPFMRTPANEQFARFSPDGKWVAYAAEEAGRREIRIVSFPDGRQVFTISQVGGQAPHWRNDGKELFYVAPDRRVHAVALEATKSAVRALSDTPLFTVPSVDSIAATFDVTPDGKRFLVPASDAPPATSLGLLLNAPFTTTESR